MNIESLFETYNSQNFSNSMSHYHIDGHCDWITGTDDDVFYRDKHEDCKSL